MATVFIETNARIQELFNAVMGSTNKRKHFTIRNKYAIGLIRGRNEIVIYDYDRSARYLAKIKTDGQIISIRLGFTVKEAEEIMETLARVSAHIDQAAVEHAKQFGDRRKGDRRRNEPFVGDILPPIDPHLPSIGINKDGREVFQNLNIMEVGSVRLSAEQPPQNNKIMQYPQLTVDEEKGNNHGHD